MKKLTYLFCFSILLISCGSDDSSNDDGQNPQGSFVSATINGESFLANNTNILTPINGQLIEEENVFFLLQMFAFIQDGRSISFRISGEDFDMVTNGIEAYEGEGDFDFSAKGFYAESGIELGGEGSGESYTEGYIKITSIDKVNKIVSGEFNFVAIGGTNNSNTYTVTNGVFNNIEYIGGLD